MKRLLISALTLSALALLPSQELRAADKKKDEVKEALQELQAFIGGWKGSGSPVGVGAPAVGAFWPAKLDWSWRFKQDTVFLAVKFEKDKYWKSGELTFDPKKETYQLTMVNLKDEKSVFTGEYEDNYLKLDRVDPKTKEAQQIVLNTAGDGVRLVLTYSHKPANRTRLTPTYRLGLTKEGESLGGVAKQRECIVTGGLGTMAVSFKGATYFVCCSGCKDAFNENPEKFIAEFKKKKK